MSAKGLCFAGLALFAALSLTDYALTYALIGDGTGAVYESNPVAAVWLERHGWVGLLAFKAAAALVVAGVVVLLARHRPKAGAGVVTFACLALLWVTVYSRQLLAAESDPADEGYPEVVYDSADLQRPTDPHLLCVR